MNLIGLSFGSAIALQTLIEILAELIVAGLKAAIHSLFGSRDRPDGSQTSPAVGVPFQAIVGYITATIAMAGCILLSVAIVERLAGVSLETADSVLPIPAWVLYMMLATGVGFYAVNLLSTLQDRDRPYLSVLHARRMVVWGGTVAFKLALLIFWVGIGLLVTKLPVGTKETLLLSFSWFLLADGLGFVGVMMVG